MSDYIPKLNQLPDVPLLEIFDRLPVMDFFTTGSVCRRWYGLANSARVRRRSLFIQVDDKISHSMPWLASSRLRLRSFRNATAQQVLNRFPSVTLAIVENYQSNLTLFDPLALNILLSSAEWSGKLVSLSVDFYGIHTNVRGYETLLKSINTLSALKYLTLWSGFSDSLVHLPIIGRLETFVFSAVDYFDRADWLSLRQYAEPSKTLRKIELKGDFYFENEVKLLNPSLEVSPELARKFTLLFSHSFISFTNEQLAAFCGHFCSLPQIRITVSSVEHHSFVTRLACLRSMTNLQYLHLRFEDLATGKDNASDFMPGQTGLSPFASVIGLHCIHSDLSLSPFEWMETVNFGHLFPNVYSISLHFGDVPSGKAQLKALKELPTASLRECKRLTSLEVKTGTEAFLWKPNSN